MGKPQWLRLQYVGDPGAPFGTVPGYLFDKIAGLGCNDNADIRKIVGGKPAIKRIIFTSIDRYDDWSYYIC